MESLWKKIGMVAALSVVLLGLVSCNKYKKEHLVFFLTIHEIVEEQEMVPGAGLVMAVRSFDGSKCCNIRSIPLLTSGYVRKAEVMPSEKPLKFGLRLYFDRIAIETIWREAIGNHKGHEVAVMVDGFYVGNTVIPNVHDASGILDIAPLWNKFEAKAIAENAAKNYACFNGEWSLGAFD